MSSYAVADGPRFWYSAAAAADSFGIQEADDTDTSSTREHRRAQQSVRALPRSITMRNQRSQQSTNDQQSRPHLRCKISSGLISGPIRSNTQQNRRSVFVCNVRQSNLAMFVLQNQVCFGFISLNGFTSRLSDMLGLSSLSLSKPDLQDIHKCTEKGQRSDNRLFYSLPSSRFIRAWLISWQARLQPQVAWGNQKCTSLVAKYFPRTQAWHKLHCTKMASGSHTPAGV